MSTRSISWQLVHVPLFNCQFQEPSGPLQACNRTALPFLLWSMTIPTASNCLFLVLFKTYCSEHISTIGSTACLYCMRKGIMSKLYHIIAFITNLPVKDCSFIACFLQLRERCSIGANMHIKSQARLV